MTDLPTHYESSSKGRTAIADMAYPHLLRTRDKLVRERGDDLTILAMNNRLAYLDSLPDDAARVAATSAIDRKGDEGAVAVTVPAAPIGHNHPPPDEPAPVQEGPPGEPFEAHATHIGDLYIEASNWADGVDIENDAQAAVVDRLIDDFKAAIAAAEASRDDEKRPLQAQVNAIQERYYPLIADTSKLKGIAIRAKAALLAVKTRWMNKVEALRAAEAAEAAKKAAELAAQAVQASREAVGDIAATETAEDLIRQAKGALKTAAQIARPVVGSGMRTVYETEIANPILAARWAWANHEEECKEFFLTLARRDVHNGARALDGFTVTQARKAA